MKNEIDEMNENISAIYDFIVALSKIVHTLLVILHEKEIFTKNEFELVKDYIDRLDDE